MTAANFFFLAAVTATHRHNQKKKDEWGKERGFWSVPCAQTGMSHVYDCFIRLWAD